MEKDIPRALGHAIRQARLRVGLSQEELAASAGLHRTYVSSIERGERNLGIINLIKMAEAMNIKASEILSNLEGTLNK